MTANGPGTALADQGGVKYEVVLTRDGEVVSAPIFLGELGKPAVIEQGQR